MADAQYPPHLQTTVCLHKMLLSPQVTRCRREFEGGGCCVTIVTGTAGTTAAFAALQGSPTSGCVTNE